LSPQSEAILTLIKNLPATEQQEVLWALNQTLSEAEIPQPKSSRKQKVFQLAQLINQQSLEKG